VLAKRCGRAMETAHAATARTRNKKRAGAAAEDGGRRTLVREVAAAAPDDHRKRRGCGCPPRKKCRAPVAMSLLPSMDSFEGCAL